MTMDKPAKFFSWISREMRQLAADKSGATAIEYAMIASAIAAVIVGSVNALGLSVRGMYQSIASLL
jgi:pilus assembly protein Flp/PilA